MRILLTLLILLTPLAAQATIREVDGGTITTPDIAQTGTPTVAYVTCYAPGAGGSIEGPFATSRPDNSARNGVGGQNIPHTLDDVYFGRSQYVTLASNPDNYGKWYDIGPFTYKSVQDGQMHTIPNLVGYVHDTGSAFNSSGCANQHPPTCSIMNNKFDIAYGDFRGGQSDSIVNSAPQCSGKQQWMQIGGVISGPGTSPIPTGVSAQPVIIGTPYSIATPGSGAGQILTQDYYCITSVEPVIVQPLPAGSVFPGNCYNSAPTTQASRPPPPQPPAQPFSAPVQSLAANNAIQTLASPGVSLYATSSIPAQILGNLQNPQTLNNMLYSAQLLVESSSLQRGNPVVLVWSSVGMSTNSPCAVSEGAATVAQTNEGSQTIPTDALTPNVLNFTLQCTSLSGASVQKTASVNFH